MDIALKEPFDRLPKLGIYFAIHLRATQESRTPENIEIVARINELKSPCCAILSYAHLSRLGKHPPLATSIWVMIVN